MVELLMPFSIANRGLPVRRAGFTLIEVMVSVTIVAIGLLVMGRLLVRSARQAEAASAGSYQTATLAAQLGMYDALPFDQLAAGTVCDTATAHPFPRISCVTVTNVSAKIRKVSVVVTPTDNPLLSPDSVVVERSISGNGNPLNSP
jgi:prepilin-type N-terminal cleavage/methylation domain-containing protein